MSFLYDRYTRNLGLKSVSLPKVTVSGSGQTGIQPQVHVTRQSMLLMTLWLLMVSLFKDSFHWEMKLTVFIPPSLAPTPASTVDLLYCLEGYAS